jgi:hypothetical protein
VARPPAPPSPAWGFPNPNGTIGFGLTVVTTPGGTPLHIDATITLSGAQRHVA